MTNTISINQTSLNSAQDRHQEAILAILSHRFKIAQSDRNLELLSLLEQERQQLEQSYQRSFQPQKRSLWDWLTQPAKVSIAQLPSTSGKYFRGYNPITGEIRYGETEADMIDWLED
jgi:hypothetical protein